MCSNMLASASLSSSKDRFIFSRGADGAIWYRRADADGWAHDWESLGGSFVSPPTALSINSERLDVFAVWSNREVRVKTFQDGAWSDDWLNLAGACVSQPSSTSFGSDRLSMLCADAEKQTTLKYYREGRDPPWGPDLRQWTTLGGWLTSAPALSSGGEEYVSAVAYGNSNRTEAEGQTTIGSNMIYIHFDTKGWIWEGGWGDFKGDPAVVAVTASQSEYFGVASNGAMWHNTYAPESSSARSEEMHGITGNMVLSKLSLDYTVPENLGGNFTSTPHAWATGLRRVDVVAVGEDGNLLHRARIDGTWAEEWEDLGGWFESAPVVWAPANLRDDSVHVFGLGPEGVVIHGTFSMGDGLEFEFGKGSWFSDGGEMTVTGYSMDD